MFVFMTIAYLAVGLVVFNAMLMSVFERIREFGIMKALGVGPLRVAEVIALEALLEAALAALCAGDPGRRLMAKLLHDHPLDLSGLMSGSATVGGMSFDPRIGATLSLGAVLTPLAFLFVLVHGGGGLPRLPRGHARSPGRHPAPMRDPC